MRIVPEPKLRINIINNRKCKDCTEPFTPVERERICPECKEEREIEKQELRESRMQK